MIEVKNLVKRYGNYLAVDHLSFKVEKGQILGFLGPNGAGKSTTMNMITGYISATEGDIVINGYNMYEEPEKAKKCIGYLPELPPVYPDMTVLEYLHFAAQLKQVPKEKQKHMIDEIMEKTKVTDVSKRLIKQLSKGYKQRVGLAQALVGNPEVVILDEPTVGLDPMQIIEIRDLMKELAKDHTVIISSHILSEINAVCDTVLIINKGKIVLSDSTERLSEHFKGKNDLTLEVKATEQQLKAALDPISEISKLQIEEGEEKGLIRVLVQAAGECDLRERIFFTLAQAKCPIYTMNIKKMSLEDIFLEMTKEEPEKQIKRGLKRSILPRNQKKEEAGNVSDL